jgi:2-polyprenyl-6-methoxyphenol hydroxylase-like FAD-dependent oxidoreductase
MNGNTYDLVIVGGGIGGSALAKVMAERGVRVLVAERETRFKDRVRGEFLSPWGVSEAARLGIERHLRETCARELRYHDIYAGPAPMRRDLAATSLQQLPALAFFHPQMQEVLLQAAQTAGAVIRRAARVRSVVPGASPTVAIETNGRVEEVRARLVVGADGRVSEVRRWGGFTAKHDPDEMWMTGALLGHMEGITDLAFSMIIAPTRGGVFLAPQGSGRFRAYYAYHRSAPYRLSGEKDLPVFIAESIKTGAAPEWYAGCSLQGPLATFPGADTWVEHPHRDGVALIGDAAGSSDPTWGQGLSLTLRDVRVLRDALLSTEDWRTAADDYAAQRDQYYGALHAVTGWITKLNFTIGPEADSLRAKALPLLAEDPSRMPDHLISGPDLPADDAVRLRYFGEQ